MTSLSEASNKSSTQVDPPAFPESSRFKVVNRPANLPGCCYLTKSSDEDWFVDTGIDGYLDWGAVYIGKTALEEMARAAGMVYPEEVDFVISGYDPKTDDHSNITPVGSPPQPEYERILNGQRNLDRKFDSLLDLVNTLIFRTEGGAKLIHPSGTGSAIYDRDSDSSESGFTEPSDVEELGNLRSIKQRNRKSEF